MITVILGYLYQSASSNTLFILDKILSADCIMYIFAHSIAILIIFGLLYIFIWILIYKREKNHHLLQACNNICRYVFNYIETKCGHEYMQNVRVSIFNANDAGSSNPTLKVFSRYQTRTPRSSSKIKIKPGVGCAGLCFETQIPIAKQITEHSKNSKKYEEECQKEFNLTIKQIRQLNYKSSNFVGVPIKHYDTGTTWGVLVADSTKNRTDIESLAREIEGIVSHYSTFFVEGGK